jgi:hypothetical protein
MHAQWEVKSNACRVVYWRSKKRTRVAQVHREMSVDELKKEVTTATSIAVESQRLMS